jgi:asparagine synthase (glutamine-hydrolysing)
MPGLVGLITRMPRPQAETVLSRMLASMRHAPFLRARTFVDEALGVYLAWTALEGSSSDADAAIDESRGRTLIFCGDERGQDHLADASFPAGAGGMFHAAVVDRREHRVQLFNDRYGLHRLYWHQASDAFYVAAEAKAILAVCPGVRQFDPRGLGEAIALGDPLEHRTLFEALSLMPGGSRWTFEEAALRRRETYFDPRGWEDLPRLDGEAAYVEVRDAFRDAVPRAFAGTARPGLSLTGGLDTRLVMAWQTSAPGALPCYTFGSAVRDTRDVVVARAVAGASGQPMTVIAIGDAFLQQFPDYAARAIRLSDGSVDARHAANLYLNERAREIAPVRVTGLFGGEFLRGVRAFKPRVGPPGLFPDLAASLGDARATYARISQGRALSFAMFRQAPWHHGSSLSLERSQVTMRSPFLDPAFARALFRVPDPVLESGDLTRRLIAEGNPSLAAIPTDLALDGSRSWRERIAHARQALTFKAEYATGDGMPPRFAPLARALGPLDLTRVFRGRHKMTHFRVWYRGPLAGSVRDILLDPRSLSRPYVDRASVERIVRDHLSGARNHTAEIHTLLRLELVCREFMDARSGD